jgi:hypothetical protein
MVRPTARPTSETLTPDGQRAPREHLTRGRQPTCPAGQVPDVVQLTEHVRPFRQLEDVVHVFSRRRGASPGRDPRAVRRPLEVEPACCPPRRVRKLSRLPALPAHAVGERLQALGAAGNGGAGAREVSRVAPDAQKARLEGLGRAGPRVTQRLEALRERLAHLVQPAHLRRHDGLGFLHDALPDAGARDGLDHALHGGRVGPR